MALLKVRQFALALDVTPACVRNWINRRQINYVKVIGGIRIESSEVDRIIRAGRRSMNIQTADAGEEAQPAPKRKEFYVQL